MVILIAILFFLVDLYWTEQDLVAGSGGSVLPSPTANTQSVLKWAYNNVYMSKNLIEIYLS